MKLPKRDVPTSDGNSTMFLKFKDGESKSGVFRGEAFEFRVKWVGGKSQIVGDNDHEGKSRWRLNFVTLEDGMMVAKVWEFGLIVYNQLAEINEEYDLSKTKIKITRRGTGTDTIYMILPLLKEPIPPKTMKEIESVHLNMLEHKAKPSAPAIEEHDAEEEIPF